MTETAAEVAEVENDTPADSSTAESEASSTGTLPKSKRGESAPAKKRKEAGGKKKAAGTLPSVSIEE